MRSLLYFNGFTLSYVFSGLIEQVLLKIRERYLRVSFLYGKSRTLEKWDYGDFKKFGVIVDVLPNTFVALGGKLSDGYIYNGRTERSSGMAITE
ncbi:hypothetical protein P4J09_30085 [Bacillus cereus]|nr:hypothetical protein [Bacillus cereus]